MTQPDLFVCESISEIFTRRGDSIVPPTPDELARQLDPVGCIDAWGCVMDGDCDRLGYCLASELDKRSSASTRGTDTVGNGNGPSQAGAPRTDATPTSGGNGNKAEGVSATRHVLKRLAAPSQGASAEYLGPLTHHIGDVNEMIPSPSSDARARNRRDSGIARAADHAGKEWQDQAVALVRWYAGFTASFLTEDFRAMAAIRGLPDPPDARAYGHVMKRAAREGIVRADGYAPARSSNLSPKVRWRSLISS